MLWHREQERKAVRGTGTTKVTSQRTCRVKRRSRGIIVSPCTYIHTHRPTSLYMCLGGLSEEVSSPPSIEVREPEGARISLPANPAHRLSVPAYTGVHTADGPLLVGIAVRVCEFCLLPSSRETRSTTKREKEREIHQRPSHLAGGCHQYASSRHVASRERHLLLLVTLVLLSIA